MPTKYPALPVGEDDIGRRIDRIVRKAGSDMSLGQVYAAIRSGAVRVNDRRTTPSHRLQAGEVLSVRSDLTLSRLADEPVLASEDQISLLDDRIVFENEHIVVVAKLRGELVHGPKSLEVDVRARLSSRPARGVSFTPGPVHRLDRNTTGLVVFAASLHGAQRMTEAIQSGAVAKQYVGVVQGHLSHATVWRDSLQRNGDARRTVADPDGLRAETKVEPIATGNGVTAVMFELSTGRTHQIRSHADINGHPLVGDRKYGGKPARGGYILHAGFLALSHEFSDIGFRSLWVPLPAEPARRIEGEFGQAVLQRIYARWSTVY